MGEARLNHSGMNIIDLLHDLRDPLARRPWARTRALVGRCASGLNDQSKTRDALCRNKNDDAFECVDGLVVELSGSTPDASSCESLPKSKPESGRAQENDECNLVIGKPKEN